MDIVSTQKSNKIHPHKFTLWIALASIIMMFAGLTSAFIVKSNQAGWVEVELPKIFWLSTAVILTSSITVQTALRAFKQRNMKQYRALIVCTLVLGTLFVTFQCIGFNWLWQHGIQFNGAGAGQFLYVIAGLHALHVIGGIIALLVITIKAFLGRSRTYSPISIEIVSTYWHFVDVLWIYLLVFFIWLG